MRGSLHTKQAIENVLTNEYKLNDDEKKIVEYSNTAVTADANHSKAITTFVLAKQLKQSTKQIIDSNEKLAKAQDNSANKMFWLTVALVVVGVVQAISAGINLYLSMNIN